MGRSTRDGLAVASVLLLSACGGGGGTSSTPAPPRMNTSLTSLIYSQSFKNDAASSTVSFELSSKTATTSTAAGSTLTIQYDAASKSYMLTETGRTQTFAPADATNPPPTPGTAAFFKTDGTNKDYLTLATTPFSSTIPNQYVQLGFWQRNQVSGSQQNTSFDIFAFGVDTPASAVPRTGTAAYALDAFGFLTLTGLTPKTISGTGNLDVDFLSSAFSLEIDPSENDLITTTSFSGGGIRLLGAGRLSSGDGTFSGNASYQTTTTSNTLSGPLNGRFYGPGTEEVGGAFSLTDSNQDALAGAFTGRRNTNGVTQNLTLTNIVTNQLLSAPSAELTIYDDGNGGLTPGGTYSGNGQITLKTDGSFSLTAATSAIDFGTYTNADKVNGAANFTTYKITGHNGQILQVALYKPGSSNTELALTYASIALMQQSFTNTANADEAFYTYGIMTQPGTLMRTGSAHYAGVAYAGAVAADTHAHYDLNGTSNFDVDFGGQRFTGGFALAGKSDSGAARDFGSFTVAGSLSNGAASGNISQGGNGVGQLNSQFYGPAAEEMAGTFTMLLNNGAPNATSIAGVVAGKRP